ncbi:MAG: hypothetical protein PQJ61_00490 [Spirochaetales bacterium]|uniref:Topoisomerase II n=1 Tax=Candidatus Thalassospirochaeta sargassi TaxID=3119039 RepID=A0AAJ1ID18_9SPIO|nr:hypothetical protein [Spirochaetales bacterium]
MAKRDPEKTLRNKKINEITIEIKKLLPEVIRLTSAKNEHSLNGKYGGKYSAYIDIKNEIILSPEQFISLYFNGFHRKLEDLGIYATYGNAYYDAYSKVKKYPVVLEWLKLFLRRTYLRNYEALSKQRPTVEESVMWIGQENASYGILITPRFKRGQWENDKSEIRHFKPNYWTIGHILETGLVIPFIDDKRNFNDVNDYLSFFKNTIVRNSGSIHEMEIASRYCDFVKSSDDPQSIPLLIPEFRFDGIEKKHIYRLDFTIVDGYSMSKVGFELSPWSTHGALKKVNEKTQKQVNEEALLNFEKEMTKLKSYFRKYDITVLVYTDSDLKNYDKIFDEIKQYLNPKKYAAQLEFQAIEDFLNWEK